MGVTVGRSRDAAGVTVKPELKVEGDTRRLQTIRVCQLAAGYNDCHDVGGSTELP